MIDLRPPQGVRSAAKRGIELVSQGKAGDGFEPATLVRARKIAAGEQLTPRHVMRMHSYFSRHAGDRKPGWGDAGKETPGYVAWMAWGGDPGAAWARRKAAEIDRARRGGEMEAMPLLAIGDEVFNVPIDEAEAEELNLILMDLTERYDEWEMSNEDESHAAEILHLLQQARYHVTAMADELAADGKSAEAADKMAAQLTTMARTLLSQMQIDARMMQVAQATYEEEQGWAVDDEHEVEPGEEPDDDDMTSDDEDMRECSTCTFYEAGYCQHWRESVAPTHLCESYQSKEEEFKVDEQE